MQRPAFGELKLPDQQAPFRRLNCKHFHQVYLVGLDHAPTPYLSMASVISAGMTIAILSPEIGRPPPYPLVGSHTCLFADGGFSP